MFDISFMKKHIITIGGLPGGGKSSTAKGVARSLGYEHFSSGDLFRKIGAERGLSLEEANLTAEKQKDIDHEVDERIVEIGQEKDNLVIDSRTAFHWIPGSFKVFLHLDSKVAAERIFEQIQKEGRASQSGSSFDEVYESILKIIRSERKRYLDLYAIDIIDEKQFDLVINTEANSLEEVIAMVVKTYEEWINIP